MIRGLSPAPGAWFDLAGVRVKALIRGSAKGAARPERRWTTNCSSPAARALCA